jgi:hypothetical protein
VIEHCSISYRKTSKNTKRTDFALCTLHSPLQHIYISRDSPPCLRLLSTIPRLLPGRAAEAGKGDTDTHGAIRIAGEEIIWRPVYAVRLVSNVGGKGTLAVRMAWRQAGGGMAGVWRAFGTVGHCETRCWWSRAVLDGGWEGWWL